ncbi:Heme-binding protein A [subsurface metagenome]
MSGDIYATDRYTVVIEYTKFDLTMLPIIGLTSWARIGPPEMREVGAHLWENQVGTGPFIFKEYIVGSYMSFDRNPNYHRTTTINGVEYQMPFIDELVVPIIPDEASMISALRTGAGDICQSVFAIHWESLDQTTPELKSVRYPITFGSTAYLKVTEPPFDNRDVRRAMMVGTDIADFQLLRQAGALQLPLHWFPLAGELPSYTPLEELPAETRLLYDYDTVKAKKMLADAGYPDGFKTEYYTMNWPEFLADAALLKDHWSKIGVELKIKAYEGAIWSAHASQGTYTGSIRQGYGGGNPLVDMPNKFKTEGSGNFSGWSDPHFDELMDRMAVELDDVKRDLIIKEAAVYLINEAIAIPQAVKVQGTFFWPWVHNHYGEYRLINDDTWILPMAYAWLDQELKAEMGY